MIKSQIFSRDYDKRYKIIERAMIKKSAKSLQKKYNSTIPIFLKTNRTQYAELFTKYYWQDFYKDLYVRVGLSFANWYAKYFDKWVETKSYDVSEYQTIWQSVFANVSAQISAKRIVGLSRTQRNNLNRIYSQKMRDPKFMALGVAQQTRILRNEMAYLSRVQATRIVRTETTTASNMAMRESATTIFPKESLMKEWQSSFLPTSRDGHMELDGEQIAEHEQFLVVADDGKSDLMSFPGDPAGSAGNVVNCTCKVFYLPKTYNERVTGGDLTNVGFGLVSNTPGGAGDLVSTGVNIINPLGGGAGVAVNTALGSGSAPAVNVGSTDDAVATATNRFDNLSTPMKNYIEKFEKLGLNAEFLNVFQRAPKMGGEFKKLFLRFGQGAKFRPGGLKSTGWNPILQMRKEGLNVDLMNTFTHEFGHVLSHYFGISKWGGSLKGYVVQNPIFKRVLSNLNSYTDAKMKGLYRKAGELYGSSKTPNGLRKLLNDYNDTLRRTGDVNESKRLLEISARKYYGDDVYDFYQRKMFRAGDDTDVHNVLQAMKKEAGYIVDSLDGAFNIANRFGRSFHIRTHEYRYMLTMGKEEFIAEAIQTYYHGNKIMEKFFPEYYKTLINLVDEWLTSLPKNIRLAIDYLTKILRDG